jgi:hypothetical protein
MSQTSPGTINCAICGKSCDWIDDQEADGSGGWYCKPCDAFTETDVEVED